jgi:hypothetical protein
MELNGYFDVTQSSILHSNAHAVGGTVMDITTLVIIIVVVLLVGGGGFYGRGRWY